MVEVKERPKTRGEHAAATYHSQGGHHRRRPDGQRHRPCLRALRLRRAAQRRRRRPHLPRGSPPSAATSRARSAASASPTSSGRPRSSASAPPRRSGDLADCDLVIEAATEKEDTKRKIYGALCPTLKRDAIVGTSTSSISITRLAVGDRPAGALHRHPLHESGAADGAGRGDPRHRHRRCNLRDHQAVHRQARQDRSRCRRTFPPSSSTACCCR